MLRILAWTILFLLIGCGEKMGFLTSKLGQDSPGGSSGGVGGSGDEAADASLSEENDSDDEEDGNGLIRILVQHGSGFANFRCADWVYQISSTNRVQKLQGRGLEHIPLLQNDRARQVDKNTIELRTRTLLTMDGLIIRVKAGSKIKLDGRVSQCQEGSEPVPIHLSFEASRELHFSASPLPERIIRARHFKAGEQGRRQ